MRGAIESGEQLGYLVLQEGTSSGECGGPGFDPQVTEAQT